MQVATINANGLTQIAAALAKHHKLGGDHFTTSMIQAWASEAEEHFADGNGCYIEIRAFDSTSGAPVEFTITPDGYDLTDIDPE